MTLYCFRFGPLLHTEKLLAVATEPDCEGQTFVLHLSPQPKLTNGGGTFIGKIPNIVLMASK